MSKNLPPEVARFLGRMYLVDIDDQDGKYYLFKKLEFNSLVAGRVITVPEGFPTDLASVPRLPLIYEAFGNRYARAAVIHDYLYTSGRESRAIADQVLREAMIASGASAASGWMWWAAVRLGGAKRYTANPAGSPVQDPATVPAAVDNVLY